MGFWLIHGIDVYDCMLYTWNGTVQLKSKVNCAVVDFLRFAQSTSSLTIGRTTNLYLAFPNWK